MTRRSLLYECIVAMWILLYGAALVSTWPDVRMIAQHSILAAVLVATTLGFIGYFWLNGVKDLTYTLWFYGVMRGRVVLPAQAAVPAPVQPDVVLVYCTYNDFNGDALERSMAQDVPVRTVILDDSTTPEGCALVDAFAAEHGVRVVRREDRIGFKAGNLNNYLRDEPFDYFVLLDSDEVIPPQFVRRCLDYMTADPSVGIVQANHMATRNVTRFQQAFAKGVDSHWPVYQTVKDRHGFLSLLGHGALVRQEAFVAADGFPLVVAEDICFSLAAREAGYRTVFAPDVTCEEEYPPDYLAFRKRHGKWTEGNMEFIRRNTRLIATSRALRWFEKLDIVLFTYSLPLTAVFSLFVIINVVVLPLLGQTLTYPWWMLLPTVAFLVAPMLNDLIFHWRTTSRWKLLRYSIGSMLLYGSMYFVSLRSSVSAIVGGSFFHITPKQATSMTFWGAMRATRAEQIFALTIVMIAVLASGTAFPVLLLAVPAAAAPLLAVLHQGRVRAAPPSPEIRIAEPAGLQR